MAGEQDDSGRFDYLFEPLDVDLANTESIDAPAIDQADADDRRSRTAATRIGIVAVIVAMIAVAVATVLLILQRPNPASRIDAPSRPSVTPSVEPIATTEPVFQTPPPVTASNVENSAYAGGRRAATCAATCAATPAAAGTDHGGRCERTHAAATFGAYADQRCTRTASAVSEPESARR